MEVKLQKPEEQELTPETRAAARCHTGRDPPVHVIARLHYTRFHLRRLRLVNYVVRGKTEIQQLANT